MIRSMPADLVDISAWTDAHRSRIAISFELIPLAGLAFLWFVGVVRARMGTYECQFFATVVQGSGLLFLAMTFCAFGIGAGMLTAYEIGGDQVITINIYQLFLSIISQIFNTYALKMAAVFMFSLSTLWLRTGVMPLVLSFFTYAMAILMFVSISLSLRMVLLFPAWVFCASLYILILSFALETIRIHGWYDPSTRGTGSKGRSDVERLPQVVDTYLIQGEISRLFLNSAI